MAEGIREGKSVSPDFDAAVKRHHLLDAIQKASDTGIPPDCLATIRKLINSSSCNKEFQVWNWLRPGMPGCDWADTSRTRTTRAIARRPPESDS